MNTRLIGSYFVALLFISALYCSTCFAQRPDPNDPHVKATRAFISLLETRENQAEEFYRAILDEQGYEALKNTVDESRQKIAGEKVADVMLESKTRGRLAFELEASMLTVDFELTEGEPVRVTSIEVGSEVAESNELPLISWDSLEKTVDEIAEKTGFSGCVVVTRDGKTVLGKGYGMANRERAIANSLNTIFAIGSSPIDFTHVSILLLKDRGKLDLDDPIKKYFDDVPADKQSITLRHLMTGQSGLPDFHDLPEDDNPDHTWIDRDEAVRRIMNQELLFKPGESRRHSHSAWGLLAAIVEIVSGQTYQEFTTENLFKPLGMNDTGFFGDKADKDRIAVGYGFRNSSDPNSPDNWGKTSWLVMGSGGQISSMPDMLNWKKGISSGKLLSAESSELMKKGLHGRSADGDMFGFEFNHSHNPQQLYMLISNSVDSREQRQRFDNFAQRLWLLVQQRKGASKFSLGVVMGVSSDGEVIVRETLPGSAARNDGLKPGDELISANDRELNEDVSDVLGELLVDGKPIKFNVRREGKTITVNVTPLPREEQ